MVPGAFALRAARPFLTRISVIEEGVHAVKKIIVLVLVALGAFAVYRKIQADRAELDLWTEATAASEN